MTPTARGQRLYAEVAELLDRLDRVTNTHRLAAREARPLRLGVPAEYFHHFILPRVTHLPFRLNVTFGWPKELQGQLEAGILDVTISTLRPAGRALDCRLLALKRFVLVSPASFFPPSEPRELEGWLLRQPWVSDSTDLALIRSFWKRNFSQRFSIQPVLVAPDLRVVQSAVELGLGLSILPEFLCCPALREGRLRQLLAPQQLAPLEQWVMAYRESDRDREEFQVLVDCLDEQHEITPGQVLVI